MKCSRVFFGTVRPVQQVEEEVRALVAGVGAHTPARVQRAHRRQPVLHQLLLLLQAAARLVAAPVLAAQQLQVPEGVDRGVELAVELETKGFLETPTNQAKANIKVCFVASDNLLYRYSP